MIKAYLFDWGDTLMVDFPNAKGKMCHWDNVEAVYGAKDTLEYLSQYAQVYIATGAADSTELDIKLAFERVGLNEYISGYFCKANLGLVKGSPEFLNAILSILKIPASHIAMVGDSYEKDIEPAISVGINPYWFRKNNHLSTPPLTVKTIGCLSELCS